MEYSFKNNLGPGSVSASVENKNTLEAGWRVHSMGPQANSNGLFWILWERRSADTFGEFLSEN